MSEGYADIEFCEGLPEQLMSPRLAKGLLRGSWAILGRFDRQSIRSLCRAEIQLTQLWEQSHLHVHEFLTTAMRRSSRREHDASEITLLSVSHV